MKKIILLAFCFFLMAAQVFPQWVKTSFPKDSAGVESFAVIGSNIFAGTRKGGVFLSADSGLSWSTLNSGLTNTNLLSLASNGPYLYAGTWGNGVFISSNNGQTWSVANIGMGNSDVRAFGFNGSTIFAGTENHGVYLSNDNGGNWTTTNLIMGVSSLIINGSNIFAGMIGDGGIFLSTNNGIDWKESDNGLKNKTVMSLTKIGNIIFAGVMVSGANSEIVYKSSDNGTSWISSNNGIPRGGSYCATLEVSGNYVFAGISGVGVFMSTNNGANWTAVNSGLGVYPDVNVLKVIGDYLFLGSWSNGVWRRPLSEMITDVNGINTNLQTEFSLSQNYPNPFNPTTKIRFDIPKQSHVKLSVFDILGREVVVLINKEMNPGSYETTFDAKQFASGVYFYRIEADEFVKAAKMVLTK